MGVRTTPVGCCRGLPFGEVKDEVEMKDEVVGRSLWVGGMKLWDDLYVGGWDEVVGRSLCGWMG